jgi:hypothetical protein
MHRSVGKGWGDGSAPLVESVRSPATIRRDDHYRLHAFDKHDLLGGLS